VADRKAQKPRVWLFMVDSRNTPDLRDLDHLDEILWGSNPNARQGDIVLMYRTAPYSDIAYVFSATSNPRPTQPCDHADTEHVIKLGNKLRLSTPIILKKIRDSAYLSKWSFARYQQGAMKRTKDIREEGFWGQLRKLLVGLNPSLAESLSRLEGLPASPSRARGELYRPIKSGTRQGLPPLRVFISYASPDIRKVRSLYRRLSGQRGLELWFDKESLVPTDDFHPEIVRAIHSSDTIIICLSSRSVGRRGFAQKEISWALKLFDEQPEGTISVLPAKLDRCDVPPRLARWQYAELFRKGGYDKLVGGLRKRAALLKDVHVRYRRRAR
jgi:TIR domain-containing protein